MSKMIKIRIFCGDIFHGIDTVIDSRCNKSVLYIKRDLLVENIVFNGKLVIFLSLLNTWMDLNI